MMEIRKYYYCFELQVNRWNREEVEKIVKGHSKASNQKDDYFLIREGHVLIADDGTMFALHDGPKVIL